MAKNQFKVARKKAEKNQLPFLFGFIGVVAVVAMMAFWVLPGLSSRGSNASSTKLAEAQAAKTRAELDQFKRRDQNFADMAAEAGIVDLFFPVFDALTVKDPVAEINLVYPQKFAAAVTLSGLGDANVTATWPAEASKQVTTKSIGAVELPVTIRGDNTAPQQFINALISQGVQVTTKSLNVAPLPPPEGASTTTTIKGQTSMEDVVSAPQKMFNIVLLFWYTTRVPPDLTAGGSKTPVSSVPVDSSVTTSTLKP